MPRTDSGCPEPLGVTLAPGGVNVAVFSAHATAIEFCLFDESGMAELARVPLPERTGDVYHGFIADIDAGRRYGLRAYGPYDPRSGHRFNPAKLLVDPYARALDRPFALHPSLFGELPDGTCNASDSAPFMPKAIVLPGWAEAAVRRPCIPNFARDRVRTACARIHEAASRNSARPARNLRRVDPSRRACAPRRGWASRSVELMPVAAAIDDWHLAPLGLANYWGVQPRRNDGPRPAPRAGRHCRAGQLRVRVPRRGHRGPSRCRAEPYGRGRRARTHAQPARPRQCDLLPQRAGRSLRQRHRLR